jgi:hypothetical protein
VKGQSIARALNDRLTEEGLKRIIARTSSYDLGYINELHLNFWEETLGQDHTLGKHHAARCLPKTRLHCGHHTIHRAITTPGDLLRALLARGRFGSYLLSHTRVQTYRQ